MVGNSRGEGRRRRRICTQISDIMILLIMIIESNHVESYTLTRLQKVSFLVLVLVGHLLHISKTKAVICIQERSKRQVLYLCISVPAVVNKTKTGNFAMTSECRLHGRSSEEPRLANRRAFPFPTVQDLQTLYLVHTQC